MIHLLLGLLDGVKVSVNDPVQVLGNNLGNILEHFEIKDKFRIGFQLRVLEGSNKHGKTDTGQVTDRRLIGSRVFHDFATQVGRANGSQVLLVGFGVGRILVQHVRSSRLDLGIQNGEPKLLGWNGLAGLAFCFVFGVQVLEFLSVDIGESRCLVGAKERPGSRFLDAFHEQIGNPERIKQIPGPVGFVSVVLSQIQKGKDIGVPWFQINGDTSLALAATLVDVTSRVVKDTQHGNNAVGSSVGAGNVGLTGTNVVCGKTNATGVLGNDGTVLECIINSVNGVFLHGQEEARGHLRLGGSGVEEGRSGMSKIAFGQEIVGLNGAVNIVSVDSDRHTHQHALRSFRNVAIHFQQV